MNNNYDREEVKPAPNNYEVIDVSANPLPVVKLVVLLNGEQILAEVVEGIGTDKVTLKNPLCVSLQALADNGDEDEATVSYAAWLPLSADRDIVVERSSVITICDPAPSLVDSYLEGINGWCN